MCAIRDKVSITVYGQGSRKLLKNTGIVSFQQNLKEIRKAGCSFSYNQQNVRRPQSQETTQRLELYRICAAVKYVHVDLIRCTYAITVNPRKVSCVVEWPVRFVLDTGWMFSSVTQTQSSVYKSQMLKNDYMTTGANRGLLPPVAQRREAASILVQKEASLS